VLFRFELFIHRRYNVIQLHTGRNKHMKNIKVIIADDHQLFREGTRNLIEQESDLDVIGEASNGEEAVELVAKLNPHVILMDIAMPKLSGIEATRQIKARCPATAVLILTAYDDDQYIFSLLEAGAAGYLLKNVSGKDLAKAIRAVYAGEAVLDPAVTRKVCSHLATSRYKSDTTTQPPNLSERELEILRLAARGMKNQEIASALFLSRRTVQAHLSNIFNKMSVGSRIEATLQALKNRWLTLDDIS